MMAAYVDLMALRALVEAAERLSHCSTLEDMNGVGTVPEDPAPIERLCLALPAAREAAERVEREVRAFKARLAKLEAYIQHGPRCPVWATMTRGTCTCGLDTALEDRDGR